MPLRLPVRAHSSGQCVSQAQQELNFSQVLITPSGANTSLPPLLPTHGTVTTRIYENAA